MNEQQLDCALDLMRRLPPQQIEKNLSDLIDLVPALCEDLLSSVDQPLKIARDKVVGKDYLLCDYNRDGDSYRSPWSNKYEPPIDDGAMPSARLRKLEVEANNAFDQYRDLYFEGGVSSVYLWDLDHGFAGVILIKKAGDGSKKIKGCWDSIHVVEVQEKSSGRTAHYKLTSTVMLWLQTTKTGSGTMNLGGSLTRQMEKDETVGESSPHIANIGRLVEDMENKIRSTLNEIYFGKTKDIVNGLRSVQTLADKSKQEALKNDLMEALKRKQQMGAMTCTLEKVLGDARTLLERLKEHDTAAESLIEQSGALSQRVHSMREVGNALPDKYQEDSVELKELSKYKPHILLTQENTQIKELQQENRELWLSLEEHQYALELIMGRYRKQMLQLMMAKKEMDTQPVLSLHEDHAKEVQSQLERICEMGQVMRRAVQVDDQHYCSVRERLAQLEIENKELRDLLSISRSSLKPQTEEKSQLQPESDAKPVAK
ncbi:hypothetical protein MATL_G00111850 [Megalops atlanticus]|uniref:F-actin-capping protein subunit beta n=1 Tax=Megalops atlanticus TaxID=7932 RepID=A0A9D3Q514_MEGAT|nr:hypothetical protein MATL_G00111850 [Megalops atlanticus]